MTAPVLVPFTCPYCAKTVETVSSAFVAHLNCPKAPPRRGNSRVVVLVKENA